MSINWELVDWTKQDVFIAKILGIHSGTVNRQRKSLEKPDSPNKHRGQGNYRNPKIWESVDWNLTNYEIAQKLGLSHQGVHQQRIKRGIPSRGPGNISTFDIQKLALLVKAGFNTSEIAEKMGVTKNTIRRHALRVGIVLPRSPCYHDWEQVDWSLTNAQIARLLGASPAHVGNMRRRLGKSESPNKGVKLKGK